MLAGWFYLAGLFVRLILLSVDRKVSSEVGLWLGGLFEDQPLQDELVRVFKQASSCKPGLICQTLRLYPLNR